MKEKNRAGTECPRSPSSDESGITPANGLDSNVTFTLLTEPTPVHEKYP